MNFISTFKARTIDLMDQYSWWTQPWQDFTRPMIPPQNIDQSDILSRLHLFIKDGLILSRIPLPEGSGLDMGDQALWHGVYLAGLCAMWTKTKDIDVYQVIVSGLSALGQHQTYHGEKVPRLIRGYDPDKKIWLDNPSNDTLTGHVFGIAAVLMWGPPDLHEKAITYLQNIASELVANNWCLIDRIGNATPYGRLVNGVKTDPLSFTLVYAILCMVREYIDDRYENYRGQLFDAYKQLIPYGKVAFGTVENWNDDHRAAIHLKLINAHDWRNQETMALVKKGVARLWRYSRKRANPWVNALLASTGNMGRDDITEMRRQAGVVLAEYDFKTMRSESPVDRRPAGSISDLWAAKIVNVQGIDRSTQPIPLWAMGAQDFPFQRCRFSVVDWQGVTSPASLFNVEGGYLCVYGLSKLTGVLL